jgi:hypothetical protein
MISGIITRLLADINVTTLVGQKIIPVIAEQGSQRPYVTLKRTGTSPTIVKNEVSGKDEVNFTASAIAETYKECIDILAAIRTSLDNFKGTSNGIEFLNVWYLVSEDLFVERENSYMVTDTYAARVKR